MHFVPIDEAEEGMINVKRLYDERETLLLNSNKPLTSSIIQKIKNLGYQGLYIYDDFAQYDNFNEIIDENTRRDTIKALKTFNLDSVTYFANEIVNSLTNEKHLCIELQELSNYHDYTYQHCINVAILSATIGIGFGFSNEQLKNLTMAALLHDIGKSDIPKEILDKTGKLTNEEFELIRKHPEYGYYKVKDNLDISSTIKIAILEHHENEDGSGYPRHLQGENIHIFAKIIHVADVYDALISKRAYKKAYEPAEAIEYLMSNVGIMFDLNVVLMFLKYIAVYPVGTTVHLSNGVLAQVVEQNNDMPLRPIVAYKNTIINLMDKKNYSLVIQGDMIEEAMSNLKQASA